MAIFDKILTLTRQLYPRGRAFKMPLGGYFESLHKALGVSEARAYNDAVSILNNILPDNDNFTADDATAWERRLGMIVQDEYVLLSDRKLAIKRKMNFPGTVPARGSYLFLQHELKAAGFEVYVFENRFDNEMGGFFTLAPDQVNPLFGIPFEHGDFEHGDHEHGDVWSDVVANNIDPEKDLSFDIGDNFRSTFFITGPIISQYANVAANRKLELRQLILRLKPAQEVAFLFVNYV